MTRAGAPPLCAHCEGPRVSHALQSWHAPLRCFGEERGRGLLEANCLGVMMLLWWCGFSSTRVHASKSCVRRPVEDTVYAVRQELGQHTPPEAIPDPDDPKSEENLRKQREAAEKENGDRRR